MAANSLDARTSQTALLTVTAPSIVPAAAPVGSVGFHFPTLVGFTYTIERTFSLADPVWEQVGVFPGSGDSILFTRPTTSFATAYFRLKVE